MIANSNEVYGAMNAIFDRRYAMLRDLGFIRMEFTVPNRNDIKPLFALVGKDKFGALVTVPMIGLSSMPDNTFYDYYRLTPP